MNSGVQDANNLAWKVALAVRGVASDALLDTFEVERRSKALLTVKSATYNSLHYQAIAEAVRIGEGEAMRQGRISPEAVNFLSQRAVPHGDNSILHTGYQFGTVYESRAIRRTAEPLPTPDLRVYVETTIPGARAPHAWLMEADGRRVSTINLWGERFTLVGYQLLAFWQDACGQASRALGLEIDLLNVGTPLGLRACDGKFASLYAATQGMATLVRPDGFVAARLAAATLAEAREELVGTMRSILGFEDEAAHAGAEAAAAR